MMNEEAINTVKSLKSYHNDNSEYCEDGYVGFDSEDNEALDLAIKALEQQPSDSNISDPCDGCQYELNSTNGNPCYSCGKYKLTEQQPCEDCISRQAVLEKKKLVELEDGQSFYCINPKDVETLPSVTPQQTRWIPVGERVPEIGQHVLVTSHGRIHICLADNYGTVTVIMPIISKDATEIVFHPQPDWGDGYAAWMPLPEPYQSND